MVRIHLIKRHNVFSVSPLDSSAPRVMNSFQVQHLHVRVLSRYFRIYHLHPPPFSFLLTFFFFFFTFVAIVPMETTLSGSNKEKLDDSLE